MPRSKESLAATDWEIVDAYGLYKEAHDPYESYDPVRPTEWLLYVAHPVPARAAKRFSRSDDEVDSLFSSLAREWRESTAIESNLDRMILDSAYQRIIGLGPQVLPHILKDLEETRDHWFWALMALVGEDKAAGQASVGAAAEAWLAWGRTTGLLDE